MDLGIVLLASPEPPDVARMIERGRELGLELVQQDLGPDDDGAIVLTVGAASIIMMVMPAPHPDAARMPVGPTSPSPELVAAAPAHLIVTVPTVPDETATVRERDLRMLAIMAAVIDSCDAIAAMLGHGVVFHRADLFGELAALGVTHGDLPAEIVVDITAARESETQMSFLTHGLPRYGREDFYVVCEVTGKGALELLYDLARWMVLDPDKQLPTGDTVGRTPEEKLIVQRCPSPIDPAATVIKLQL